MPFDDAMKVALTPSQCHRLAMYRQQRGVIGRFLDRIFGMPAAYADLTAWVDVYLEQHAVHG